MIIAMIMMMMMMMIVIKMVWMLFDMVIITVVAINCVDVMLRIKTVIITTTVAENMGHSL